MVDDLPHGVIAIWHEDSKVQRIQRSAFDKLTTQQQAAVFRREHTVYADDFIEVQRTQ